MKQIAMEACITEEERNGEESVFCSLIYFEYYRKHPIL